MKGNIMSGQGNGHKQKLGYLDIARGIGIVVVILAHIDTGDNPLCSWIGSFCMAIFFFVSGALLSYLDRWRNENALQIIIKRIKGVMYPYFSFSLLIILCYTFARIIFKRGSFSNIIEIVKSTVTLSGYDALWFMPTLFFAEVICVLLLRYFGRGTDTSVPDRPGMLKEWIGFCFVTATSLVCYYILHNGIIQEYSTGWFSFVKLTRVLMSAVFIYAGYFYFEYKDKIFSIGRKILIPFAVIWLIIDFPIAQPNHFVDYAFVRIVSLPLQYVTGILTSFSILYLFEVLELKCRPLEFFGRNSLTMMATHNPLPVLAFIYDLYKKYVPGLGRYPDDFIILIIVLIAEVPIVLLINRFLPFIVRWPGGKTAGK